MGQKNNTNSYSTLLISLRSSSLVRLAKEKLNSIAFDRSITLGMDKAKRDLYQQSAIKFLKNF